MFPEETHARIVQRLDEIEADMFRIYRSLERLRLSLQEQWRVSPSDETEQSRKAVARAR